MAENERVRFMANNLASLTVNSKEFTSEEVGFEGVNVFNSFRSSTWKATGQFLVTLGSNDKLYIDDGSLKTITLDGASYKTPLLLATEIQTKLNATSSGFTVTYDLVGGTYKFTIANSGSVTLKLSNQFESIWNDIGFTGTTDLIGTDFIADQQRNHTNEAITLDFGYLTPVEFVGIVSDVSKTFGLSSSAIVTLEGNNIDQFSPAFTPPFSKTLNITDQGIFEFNIEVPTVSHRFWRLNIVDKFNTTQGPAIEIGNVYLGSYQTLTGRNITTGLTDQLRDPSKRSESEGGVLFFDKRVKYTKFSQIPIRLLENADKQVLKDVFRNVGTTEPFYISLDPTGLISADVTEFTKFVIFDAEPIFTSVGSCFFNTSLNVREVV